MMGEIEWAWVMERNLKCSKINFSMPGDYACHLPINRVKVKEKANEDEQWSEKNNYRQKSWM